MRRLGRVWLTWVKELYTGYFASVMATGIVSTALVLNGQRGLSLGLLGVACALLIFFVIVYVLRAVVYPGMFASDLRDPTKVFGFFTAVAGIGVVATRLALGGLMIAPAFMTLIATAVWLALTYWTFSMLIFSNERPIEKSVNGAWLICIVGTESLSITWVLLTRLQPGLAAPLELISYLFWAFGILLYLMFLAFILYRFFFVRVRPDDLTPPYWINMGAMAITTVAGARLVELPHASAFVAPLLPFIEGFTIMLWAWGSWWIPLLIIIGIWKYGIEKQPLRYAPALWSIVFPLGMYATAITLLSKIVGLGFLLTIAVPAMWVAFGAWMLTALGWIFSMFTAATRGETEVKGAQSGKA